MIGRWVILIFAFVLLACEQSEDVEVNQSPSNNLASEANKIYEEELGQQQSEILKEIEPNLGQLLSTGYTESHRVPTPPTPSESVPANIEGIGTRAIIFGRRGSSAGLGVTDQYECAVPTGKQFKPDWSKTEMVDWGCKKIDG